MVKSLFHRAYCRKTDSDIFCTGFCKFLFFSLLFLMFSFPHINAGTVVYDTTNARKSFFFDDKLNFENLRDFKEIVNDDNREIGVIFSKWDSGWDIAFYPAYNGSDNERTYGRIVYRFDEEQKLQFVKVFFIENSDSYILFKRGTPGKYDIVLMSSSFRTDITYHFDINRLKFLDLYSIFSIIDEKTRTQIFIRTNDSDTKINFINSVIVPSFNKYSDDGAINQFDEYVSINSLENLPSDKSGVNCSGFVKEIYDRYLMSIGRTDKRSRVELFKKRNFNDNDRSRQQHARYEFTEDPFFGRDWMENLNEYFNSSKGNISDYAEEIKEDQYSPYFTNRGFNLDELSSIVYRNYIENPDFFYVIVFNKYAANSTLVPKHYHISVLVPYSRGKRFIMRVFESGTETGYGTLLRNHLPSAFDAKTFEDELLIRRGKILTESEIELLKRIYIRSANRRFYNLNRRISDEDAFRAARIFSKLEYREEKVLLYRIPVSYHFYRSL